LAAKELVRRSVVEDTLARAVPVDAAAEFQGDHAEECHVAGEVDFADVAHGKSTRVNRVEEIGPVFLDVLRIGRVKLRRFAAGGFFGIAGIERPTFAPAEMENSRGAVEIAADVFAFVGGVAGEL